MITARRESGFVAEGVHRCETTRWSRRGREPADVASAARAVVQDS